MSQLFSPVSLGKLELPNRIIIAPMCQYSAEDGKATAWHTMHLGNLSHSGAGLLIIEATAVSPEGRISPRDLGLWDDATEQALAGAVNAVKTYSAMPLGIQLGHAGRKASTGVPWSGRAFLRPEQGGWQTIAPSAIPYNDSDAAPLAMSEQHIRALIDSFVSSAKRADRLGFDLIEIHAAHGYLLHQFLSPLTNQRTDNYGGHFRTGYASSSRFTVQYAMFFRRTKPLVCAFLRQMALRAVGIWSSRYSLVKRCTN